MFGFLGPNGAGKTTTIRMLTGLLTPDSGDIFIDGVDIKRNPIKAKMKMGVIPEMGNVYVDLTAKQNIILSGKFYGIPRRDVGRRADSLLEQFELYERRDDHVKTFSKGMKQRINIASAIIHNPQILFLDEPTSGLDVQSQRLIRGIIRQMNQEGTTIFLTTHNIEEANILCERVGIINKGKMAAIDRPEKLRRTFEETQSVEISFDNSSTHNFFSLYQLKTFPNTFMLSIDPIFILSDPSNPIFSNTRFNLLSISNTHFGGFFHNR
jgi:ABC-2 type transport system ATP-binding protein